MRLKRIVGVNGNKSAGIITRIMGNLEGHSENNVEVELQNILYAKNVTENVLSLRKLVEDDLHVILTKQFIRVVDPKSNKTVIMERYEGKFWWLKFKTIRKPEFCEKALILGESKQKQGFKY